MPFKITNGKSLLASAKSRITAIGSELGSFAKENPLVSGVSLVAAVGGATAIIRKVRRKPSKKGKKVSRKKTTKGRSRDRKYISKQKHERAYVRRKRKAGKKITRKRYKTRKKGSSKRGKFVSFTTKDGKKVKFKVKS